MGTASGGAGRGDSADSCPIRVSLESAAGCPANDPHQGKQCLQLYWSERREPEDADGARGSGGPLGCPARGPNLCQARELLRLPPPRRKVRGGLGPWPMLWDRISLARSPALPFCSGGGLALRTNPLIRAWPPGPALERRDPRPGVQVWGANPGPAPLHPLGCPSPLLREELGVGSPLRRQILGARHRVLTPA